MIEKLRVGDWIVDKEHPNWGPATVTEVFGSDVTGLVKIQFWCEKDLIRFWSMTHCSKV